MNLIAPLPDTRIACPYHYTPKALLTPTEARFHTCLEEITQQRCRIQIKPRLADVFDHDRVNGAFQMISQKHIDFLICRNDDWLPMLGIELDDVNVVDGDSEVCGHTMVTFGSNGMHMVARATKAAAQDAKRQLLEFASRHLEANPADLDIKDRRIFVKGTPDVGISMKKLMSKPIYEYLAPPEVIGRASLGVEFDKAGKMMMCDYAEVEIDTRTAQMKVSRFVACHDSGTIVNPAICENQVAGGYCQSLGMSTTEHLVFDEETGAILNPNFMDYKILGPLDMPDPEIHFADVYDEDGPFGAKGIGEGVTCAVPVAISNAVYNAIGVRLNPPITPDKILRALREKRG